MANRRYEATILVAMLSACKPDNEPVVTDPTGVDTIDGDETSGAPTDPSSPTMADTGDTGGDGPAVLLRERNEVDILFVIDNSGSMAEEQARLAQDIGVLVDALAGLDIRVGMTTTDAGNPRCANTTPEGGNLVLMSCLDRMDAGEFVTGNEDFGAACTDVCAKRDSDLSVTPTATEVDPNKVPREWVERAGGALNIGGVADATEALRCYLPQGVVGCGFESHLESMYRALAAAKDKNSKNNYGFVRDSAVLAVVVVTDEADCSYAPDHKSIFIDNKVFWSSPDDPAPTSGLCWRAGVACSGGGPTYTECHAENYDESGAAGAADADAVLYPIAKYIDFVQTIEDLKKGRDPLAEVVVGLIAGVPLGYESFGAEIPYADAIDQGFQNNFGIGPGCIVGPIASPEASAVPPVREREFAEAFNVDPQASRNLYSVCDASYAGALAQIGDSIREQIPPLCFPECVADGEAAPGLQPNCVVTEEDLIEDTSVALERCVESPDGWAPPAGQSVCFALLADKGGATPSAFDDMEAECLDFGFNLQFQIVRTAPKPLVSSLRATCALSDNSMKDCPNL